jgi:hypothetical protein
MSSLVHQRCFTHAQREAVARCPSCHRYFCRECITEHADRVLCASCLKKIAAVPTSKRSRLSVLVHLAQCVLGLFVAWLFFYFAGRMLLLMPSSFHEGTVWQRPLFDDK